MSARSTQWDNGVVDRRHEREGRCCRQALSVTEGAVDDFEVPDQRALRHLIPEARKRAYDVRPVVDGLFDTGSVLELRRGFGHGMVTALARVDGHPIGVIANDPVHLGGAIDANGDDKAARFVAQCDAFDLPILFLVDTPGFMVGPASETTATVRHFARMFVAGASVRCRQRRRTAQGYNLGAMAMAAGGFKAKTSPSAGRPRSSAVGPRGASTAQAPPRARRCGGPTRAALRSRRRRLRARRGHQLPAPRRDRRRHRSSRLAALDRPCSPTTTSRPVRMARRPQKRPHLDTW
jgi:acetyl-CoA carboxylase carboxyltransferase component